jgi:hypothetical protein
VITAPVLGVLLRAAAVVWFNNYRSVASSSGIRVLFIPARIALAGGLRSERVAKSGLLICVYCLSRAAFVLEYGAARRRPD